MTLPPVGTKVVRGPTWNWDNQDSSGVGTVIVHRPKPFFMGFSLSVLWPNGSSNGYRYTDEYQDVIPLHTKLTFEDLL